MQSERRRGVNFVWSRAWELEWLEVVLVSKLTEGALEIYCISARSPTPVWLGFYLSHTNYRPTHGTSPACSSLNFRKVRPCHFICPRVGGWEGNFFGLPMDSMLSSCLLRCAKLCSQWSWVSACIVSRIFIGFSPIVFARMAALWWKTCECNCTSKFDRISYLTAIARAWNLGDIRLYPDVSIAHVTRPYGRVTWDVNSFACPEIIFNFIYALDITSGTLYG
jgi:hypothetical protein